MIVSRQALSRSRLTVVRQAKAYGAAAQARYRSNNGTLKSSTQTRTVRGNNVALKRSIP